MKEELNLSAEIISYASGDSKRRITQIHSKIHLVRWTKGDIIEPQLFLENEFG